MSDWGSKNCFCFFSVLVVVLFRVLSGWGCFGFERSHFFGAPFHLLGDAFFCGRPWAKLSGPLGPHDKVVFDPLACLADYVAGQ